MKSSNYFIHNWEDIVDFCENSPSKLVWKSTGKRAGWMNYKINGNPNGWRLEYKEKNYYCHKIIAILKLQLLDNDMVVNHINCNPFDNSLSNLEICTASENMRKRTVHISEKTLINNTSGINGVGPVKDGNTTYFKAYWHDPSLKKQLQFYLPVKQNRERSKLLAERCRLFAIFQLNLSGANYSEKAARYSFDGLSESEIARAAVFNIPWSSSKWLPLGKLTKDDMERLLDKFKSYEDIYKLLKRRLDGTFNS